MISEIKGSLLVVFGLTSGLMAAMIITTLLDVFD
ncbi:hypothetical protein Syn8016DRAFT_0210 [Synechococcus sp. WH 8016]|nr:hypothetical protein Syn8016DRAFT_0210 [Synechococcus sp. WH 8016]